jgi:hypothetical protein
MRDPELVARAQRAAARLESAWERWRALQGLGETPTQPVVGYVGYALREPWGQPRAVIGFSADEAERLAEFLERDSGDLGAIDLTALGGAITDRAAGDRKAAERSRETSTRQVPEQPKAPVLTVTPAVKTDSLAVTSQLSGLQLGHRFLPGSGARLSITSARQSVGPCHSRLGSGRPGPGPSPDSYFSRSDPQRLRADRKQLREASSRSCFVCAWSRESRLVTRRPAAWPGPPPWCSTCTASRRSGSC